MYVYKNHLEKRHDCMYAVCPSIGAKQQNKQTHIFSEVESFLSNKCYAGKKMVRFLNSIKDVLH